MMATFFGSDARKGTRDRPVASGWGILVFVVLLFGGSSNSSGEVRRHGVTASKQASSWIERRRGDLAGVEDPKTAAEDRFELAEEIAALRGGASLVTLTPSDRRVMLELLAEAVEFEEAWTRPALRLAAHAESDPRRRDRLERMARAVAGDPAEASVSPQDRLEESRFLVRYLGGRIEEAESMRERLGFDMLLSDAHLDRVLDGGGDRVRRDLETGTSPILRPDERRRLVEFDRARLSPESATFADSAWLDGWSPLPEIDAGSMAMWLRSMGR